MTVKVGVRGVQVRGGAGEGASVYVWDPDANLLEFIVDEEA